MPTQTIPCTIAEFNQLLVALPQEGCVISNQTGTSGTVTDGGTVMSYLFDGTHLTVTGVSKTAWVPTWSQIFALLKTHLVAVNS